MGMGMNKHKVLQTFGIMTPTRTAALDMDILLPKIMQTNAISHCDETEESEGGIGTFLFLNSRFYWRLNLSSTTCSVKILNLEGLSS